MTRVLQLVFRRNTTVTVIVDLPIGYHFLTVFPHNLTIRQYTWKRRDLLTVFCLEPQSKVLQTYPTLLAHPGLGQLLTGSVSWLRIGIFEPFPTPSRSLAAFHGVGRSLLHQLSLWSIRRRNAIGYLLACTQANVWSFHRHVRPTHTHTGRVFLMREYKCASPPWR